MLEAGAVQPSAVLWSCAFRFRVMCGNFSAVTSLHRGLRVLAGSQGQGSVGMKVWGSGFLNQ